MEPTQKSSVRNALIVFGGVAIVMLSIVAAALVAQRSLAPEDSSAAGPALPCTGGQRTCYGQRYYLCMGPTGGTGTSWRDVGTDPQQCDGQPLGSTQCNGGHLYTCVAWGCGGTAWNADSVPDAICQPQSGGGTSGGGTSGGGSTGGGSSTGGTTGGSTGTPPASTPTQVTRSATPTPGPTFDPNKCYGGAPSCDGKQTNTKIKLDSAGNTCTCRKKPNTAMCGCYEDPRVNPTPVAQPSQPSATPQPPLTVRHDDECAANQNGLMLIVQCLNQTFADMRQCVCDSSGCKLGDVIRAGTTGNECAGTPEPPSCQKFDFCTSGSGGYCPSSRTADIIEDKNILCNSGRFYCQCME